MTHAKKKMTRALKKTLGGRDNLLFWEPKIRTSPKHSLGGQACRLRLAAAARMWACSCSFWGHALVPLTTTRRCGLVMSCRNFTVCARSHRIIGTRACILRGMLIMDGGSSTSILSTGWGCQRCTRTRCSRLRATRTRPTSRTCCSMFCTLRS